MQDQILEMKIRIKFCLTNGEGGEEISAKSVWVEGEAVVDERRAERFQGDLLLKWNSRWSLEGEKYQLVDECRAEIFENVLVVDHCAVMDEIESREEKLISKGEMLYLWVLVWWGFEDWGLWRYLNQR